MRRVPASGCASWPAAGDLLVALAGPWRLAREIDNGAAMRGIAVFAGHGGGRLGYHERGRLRLPDGQVIEAERRYLFTADGPGFAVWFAENPPRLFHRVALERLGSSLVGQAAHRCGDDGYDSRYEFAADGGFAVEHTVRGPRKRYTIRSRYERP